MILPIALILAAAQDCLTNQDSSISAQLTFICRSRDRLLPLDQARCFIVDMAPPRALVYRSHQTDGDNDLPGSVANLLKSSPYAFEVDYIGPAEYLKLEAKSLRGIDLLAFPGGPDLDDIYAEVEHAKPAIREFVHSGGRYLGICLGAYLAGYSPGLGLLPKGADTDQEYTLPDSQVKDEDDTIIQVDWNWQSGKHAGHTQSDQWMFFQDGACVEDFKETETDLVLGRYSSSGRVASCVNKFGQGRVGVCGPHPEADQSWCKF
jgi:hypothetical protein